MTAAETRYGMTVPFGGPLHEQADRFRELSELGYTDAWTAEADGHDGLTPLSLASVWAPDLRLGTAILPVYTRGPALLAQSAAALASAAPGRFVLGIGSSSNVIVERWNAIAFEEPYQRVRDTVRFLRAAFTGEKVTEDFESFEIRGFRLGEPPEQPPPIVVAALREGMLRLPAGKPTGRLSTGCLPRTPNGSLQSCGRRRRQPDARPPRWRPGSSSVRPMTARRCVPGRSAWWLRT